jgi:hypothetical protein
VVKLLRSPGVERCLLDGKAGTTVKPESDSDKLSTALDNVRLRRISEITIGHYDRLAADFWHGTRNHDVSQNYEAFLEAIEESPPASSSTWGVGQDGIYIISGLWVIPLQAWTDRKNSWLWPAPIPAVKFYIKIFSR